MYRRLVDAARARAGPTSSSRSTFPTSTSGSGQRRARARHPGRLLHQPAALGLAARPHRTPSSGFADTVLPIFPFETEVYERAGVPVEFVGHPLIDLIATTRAARSLPVPASGSTRRRRPWPCCPGSRPNEVRQHRCRCSRRLPRQIRAGRAGHAVRRRARAQARDACSSTLLAQRARRSRWSRDAPTTCCMRAMSC